MKTNAETSTTDLLLDVIDAADDITGQAQRIAEAAALAGDRRQLGAWEMMDAAASLVGWMNQLEDMAMHTAHACGLSWTEIGEYHGISRQAAAKKWSSDALKRKYWTGYDEANPKQPLTIY
jgi:hypothetical protein